MLHPDLAAACAGKQPFDRATAGRVCRDHNAMLKGCDKRGRKARKRTPVVPFACPHCGHWHVGTPKKETHRA